MRGARGAPSLSHLPRLVPSVVGWVGAHGFQQLKWEREAKAINTTDGQMDAAFPDSICLLEGTVPGPRLGADHGKRRCPCVGSRDRHCAGYRALHAPETPRWTGTWNSGPSGLIPPAPTQLTHHQAGRGTRQCARSPSTHWKLADEIKTTGRGGKKGTRHHEFITDTVLSTQIQWSYKRTGRAGHQPPVDQTFGHSACRWRCQRRPNHCRRQAQGRAAVRTQPGSAGRGPDTDGQKVAGPQQSPRALT